MDGLDGIMLSASRYLVGGPFFLFFFSRSPPDLFSTFFYAYTIVLRSSSRFWIVGRSR